MAKQTWVRFSPDGTRARYFRYNSDLPGEFYTTTGWCPINSSMVNPRQAAYVADAVMFNGRGNRTKKVENMKAAQTVLNAWRKRCEADGLTGEQMYDI